jgi:cation:H+ antiporter
MNLIDFDQLSLSVIILIFTCAAGVVWFGGTRLSRYANALAKKTGTADVIMGTLLLGGVTSLPEAVTTITASSEGNAAIAINNLFGGVALQVTVLVFGDALLRQRSITSLIGSNAVELQAVICILLLATSASISVAGDFAIGHIGIGSIFIFLLFVSGFILINYFQSIHWWRSDPEVRDDIRTVKKKVQEQMAREEDAKQAQEEEKETRRSLGSMLKTRLFLYLVLRALAVLVAGYAVVQSGDAIATKTGLGSGVVGGIFIALATSLPELSTTISLVRLQEYRLAFSNIFGTNIFTVGFVFLADLFYMEGPVLNQLNNFSLFGALLGILLTSIYLVGMLIRFKKTILNLGFDSLLVLLVYAAGVFLMFTVLKS